MGKENWQVCRLIQKFICRSVCELNFFPPLFAQTFLVLPSHLRLPPISLPHVCFLPPFSDLSNFRRSFFNYACCRSAFSIAVVQGRVWVCARACVAHTLGTAYLQRPPMRFSCMRHWWWKKMTNSRPLVNVLNIFFFHVVLKVEENLEAASRNIH